MQYNQLKINFVCTYKSECNKNLSVECVNNCTFCKVFDGDIIY